MAQVLLKNVNKVYKDGYHAVKNADLEINEKEFLILVGPSGCGKSTMLRMIAGLEDITSGELWIDNEFANYTDAKDRGLSMMFQNYALYPNMTVYKNIAFSLEIRGVDKKEIDGRVKETAEMLGITEFLNKRPKELSGGQMQRVAIASAIIRKPKLLLMDEPLSNLDAKLRARMRVELARMHTLLQNTIIYVTHDQTEAMTLGTRIVVMKAGEIQQIDTPAKLYTNPVNRFVAGFIGSPSMNFLECKVIVEKDNRVMIDMGGYCLEYRQPLRDEIRNKLRSLSCTVGIRPEAFIEARRSGEYDERLDLSGEIEVTVSLREALGSEVLLHFDMGNAACCMRTNSDCMAMAGDTVSVCIDMKSIYLFDNDTGENILYKKQTTHRGL